MIIDIKKKSDFVLFANDPSKPEEHIFVYKLTNLDSIFSDNDGLDIYVAVPNGHRVSILDIPKGSYYMERMNKE
ncbi:MAG: hypothetical protein MJ092_05490 [Lachnospiraceae bacterium]|nr:hypothetical protein [Lachnospiraceae bacterium]